MPALAAVARGDDRLAVLAPRADHALDRLRRKIRPVGQDDDRGLCIECLEATAKRCSRASFPICAADDPRVGLDVVGA